MELGLGKYSDPKNELGYGEAILLNILETYELEFSIGSWRDKKDITWNETYIEYKSRNFQWY